MNERRQGMKYTEHDFTIELENKVKKIESDITEFLDHMLNENRPKFREKGLQFEAELDRSENHPFTPGYTSSITTAIFDDDEEYFELYTIPIWKCQRYFLGISTTKRIPGSKIVGELLEESINDIKLELNEYILEQLTESKN